MAAQGPIGPNRLPPWVGKQMAYPILDIAGHV